jgi:hypothetical protein
MRLLQKWPMWLDLAACGQLGFSSQSLGNHNDFEVDFVHVFGIVVVVVALVFVVSLLDKCAYLLAS